MTVRKVLKGLAIAVAVPVVLVLTVAGLLYVPPVQQWAAGQVTAIASEETGMDISVGRVRLRWPLRLGVTDFCAMNAGDTVAAVKDLAVTVSLKSLVRSRVVIGSLQADSMTVCTGSLLSDIGIRGKVERLWMKPDGIDLRRQLVRLKGAELTGACLDIALSDTAAVDTTTTEPLAWVIRADSIAISRSQLTLRLPGDTLNVGVGIGRAVARALTANLPAETYGVDAFNWTDGWLTYDETVEALRGTRYEVQDARNDVRGFNAAHIALTEITLDVDSVLYSPVGTSFTISHAAMKERCGLDVQHLAARLHLNSDFTHLSLPMLALRTADSDVTAEAEVPLNPSFWGADATADDLKQTVRMRLNANVGKQDLTRMAGSLPQKMIERYPNHPLTLRGSVEGNMEHMQISGLDINLPTALHLNGNGTVDHLSELLRQPAKGSNAMDALNRMKADVSFEAESRNLDFLTAMLPADISSQYTIPHGLTLKGTMNANGRLMQTKLKADIPANGNPGANGHIEAEGKYNTATEAYNADININRLNVKAFMPRDSIGLLTATVSVDGQGTDLLSPKSRLNADANIAHLTYGHWQIDSVRADARLKDGNAQAHLVSHNPLLDGTINLTGQVSTKRIDAVIKPDIAKADFFRMRLADKELAIGMSGTVEIQSDMKKQHLLRGRLGGLWLKDDKRTYRPEDVGLFVSTSPDTTWVRAQSGNLIMKLDATGGYEQLMAQAQTLMDTVTAQYRDRMLDQPAVKRQLPNLKLHLSSGRENPLADILRSNNIEFKELLVDLTTSPLTGINGQAHLYSLVADSTRIDTIRLNLTQRGDRLTYQGQVTNNKHNPQFVFNALVDGHIHEHGALAGVRYWDSQGRMGLRLGATAEMESEGLRIRLMPERPTIGYKEFVLNKDNYIFMGSDKRLTANVDLLADDGTGLKLYTTEQTADETDDTAHEAAQLDLTLSLNRFNLGELTSVIPYMPQMTGLLNGDFHIVQNDKQQISVVSDMAVREMTYEGSPIGNISTELVYLQREDDGHAIEARLMLDDEEFGLLSGTYWQAKPEQDARIDATFQMTRLPLSLANGFVPDRLLGLDGYGEGTLTIKGTTNQPVVDGEVMLDSAYLVSQPYGIRMRFDNDPVQIVRSHLLLENFGLYAYNEEPLNMLADIDFSNTDKVKIDMRMRARNLLLINARQTPEAVAFGKAFVNFAARLQGPVESLQMRGRLDVLNTTSMTYMLLDSPLSTDNRLDELVKFTDFSDSTKTVVSRPAPSGLDADLTISISEGAHIVCNLNAEQTNYIDLTGGGDLRMRYNAQGLALTGRYTLNSGEMKYSLPVIPLKTFNIQNGSYVEFTGDPMNPRLNITATERTKATVGQEGGPSRSVLFDCGVVITQTLSSMGVQFIISAPEDMTINSELQSMSTEERGKLAVTMLTTGMYLADGNTSGFSMNSVLSAYLQSEINNITGSALKTLDLSVGLDNTTDASGAMHTDYSFKFSKRLLNNRLRIQLGGKVSSGETEMPGQKQSFFDNVTMEYRLDQSGTKNVKLFYQQNVYDWLDGYTGLYGGGYVWRKKMNSLWDVFKMFSNDSQRQPAMTRPEQSLMMMRRDSVSSMRRDSVSNDTLKTQSP